MPMKQKQCHTVWGRSGCWSEGDDERVCLSHPKPHPGGPHDRVPPGQADRWHRAKQGHRPVMDAA